MESPLYLFEPVKTELNSSLMAYAIITVLLALTLGYFSKKKVDYEQRNMKQMLLMLVFFGFMIMLGTTFFTWWTSVKIIPVTITETTIETPYGVAQLDNIRNAYIHTDKQSSSLSPELVRGMTKFLVIEEHGRKTHALSEEHYNIKEVLVALRKVLKVEEKKED